MTDSQQLLAAYFQEGSEDAFRELLTRYLDLVYSTALRLVDGDTHLADDVTQSVFVDLTRQARAFSAEVMLGGWLHRHTCFVAAKTMRGERRRQSRERQAVEMNALQQCSETDFSLALLLLDEAINELGEADRTAMLLRFFEQHDFRAVGQALGISEDAARMRVNRALERLESLLKRRGITTSAAALSMVLSANAVQAAPIALSAAITTACALARTTLAAATTTTATKAIVMTTLQKTLIAALILGAAVIGFQLLQQHEEQPQQQSKSRATTTPPSRATQERIIPQVRRLSKPAETPINESPEIQQAISNLWQALRENPEDDEGVIRFDKVKAAIKSFGPNITAAIPTLLEGLKGEDKPNSMLDQSALWGLQFMGNRANEAIPSLIELFESKSQRQNTRIFAMLALQRIGGYEYSTGPGDASAVAVAIPNLIAMFNDDDSAVVEGAAGTLGSMGKYAKDAGPALTTLLNYSAPPEADKTSSMQAAGIRREAALALGKIGPDAQTAVPQLSDLLNDSDISVKASAATALWKITGQTDLPARILVEAINDTLNQRLQSTVFQWLEALGDMGSAAEISVPNLLKLCSYQDATIRGWVLKALKKIDPVTAAKVQLPEPASSTPNP